MLYFQNDIYRSVKKLVQVQKTVTLEHRLSSFKDKVTIMQKLANLFVVEINGFYMMVALLFSGLKLGES